MERERGTESTLSLIRSTTPFFLTQSLDILGNEREPIPICLVNRDTGLDHVEILLITLLSVPIVLAGRLVCSGDNRDYNPYCSLSLSILHAL